MSRRSWDDERLAKFLSGPVMWGSLAFLILFVVGVTVSYLDITVSVGSAADELAIAEDGLAVEARSGTEADGSDTDVDSALAELGASVFATNCAGCHGPSGEGGVGPTLAGRSIDPATISSIVGSGRGVMPSFASQFSADEVAAVVEHVVGLGAGPAGEEPGTETSTETAEGSVDGAGGTAGTGGGSVSGASVFASNCAGCHGASGQGGVGPALASRSIARSDISSIVGSGRGVMPSFASQLSADEVAAVVDYVVGLGARPAGGAGNDGATGDAGGGAAGDVAGGTTTAPSDGGAGGAGGGSVAGASVFASNCAGCHGSSGEGGVGPALAGRSIDPATITSIVGSGRGVMPSFASQLSADEVAAVVEYVVGLGAGTVTAPAPTAPPTASPGVAPSGSVEPFAIFCASCHGADGRGTEIGRDLRGREDKVFDAVRFGEDGMPAFPPAALSDAQLGEIVAYVRSIKENS